MHDNEGSDIKFFKEIGIVLLKYGSLYGVSYILTDAFNLSTTYAHMPIFLILIMFIIFADLVTDMLSKISENTQAISFYLKAQYDEKRKDQY